MDLPKLSTSSILKGVQNPQRALLELNKIYHVKVRGRTGINVIEEDWDNLIILDGCRYDIFEEENHIKGELKPVYSKGSQTVQFLKNNFNSDLFPEVVYVSANPNLSYIDAKFCDRIRLWQEDWDQDLQVVPPSSVTDRAIEIAEKYPNKRLIIHYMQPHFPFIGDYGQELYSEGEIKHHHDGNKFYRQLDNINTKKFKQAYRENLQIALPHVKKLIQNLRGKSVITSDHGNEFGHLGVYGHPSNTATKGLLRVPWLSIDKKKRKQIQSGSASIGAVEKDSEVREKLKRLGYI